MSKVNIVLDASKIDLDETCPRRYQFRHIFNKTIPQKAEALDVGGLCHQGFEVYFNELAKQTHFDDRMNLAMMKIRSSSADETQSNLDPDDVNLLVKAFEESCDYWRSEDENSLEVLGVEEPFAYVLYEDDLVRIIISGKIDLRVNFHGIGRAASYSNMPMDHKTFRRDSEILRKSNQFINYCSAVNSMFLVVNRVGLQKTLSAEERFKRIPLSYDTIYINGWKDNLTKMILHEYMTCIATDYWPEKPTSCNKFNRICEYYKVCDSSRSYEDKIIKLNAEYVDAEPWDVTKVLTNE